MYRASSLARNTTAAATSWARPIFPSGIIESARSFAFSGRTCVIFVSMKPGATAFAHTFRPASSRATVLVNPTTPAFDAE